MPKTELASALPAAQLRRKIETRTAKVGIIGLGYVGLPLGLLFSEEKFPVIGFDIDANKIEKLNSGASYIHHIPATEIQAAGKRGFRATADYAQLAQMDAIIICVPTPLDEYREPDLSYIESTAAAIAPYLQAGQLVVLESTTYPGTTEEVLVKILEGKNPRGLKAARRETAAANSFFVAFSPEREDPGNQNVARRDIPKVIGGMEKAASELASLLYSSIFNRTVVVSSPAAAEMTKLLENIYRCVNIALVNELKMLCLRMGINIWEVIEAASTKPFGFHPFYPGPGLGGHCIPIDPFYLSWKAKEYDFQTRFIELAGEINTAIPRYVVERIGKALNDRSRSIRGSKILLLGVAYKKNVDDVRESPALEIMEILQHNGAVLSHSDPYIPRLHKMRAYDFSHMSSLELTESLLKSQDLVLITTDHTSIDYQRVVDQAQLVVDTRNATRSVTRGREKIV